MKDSFVIPLNGLTPGRTEFRRKVGKEFFESFDNAEILDSDVDVLITVEKSNRYIGVDVDLKGHVTVSCDRCLEDLDLPVEASPKFSVKFGNGSATGEDLKEGDREIIMLPDSNADLDLSQIVYDFINISLPMQRVHADGGCNPEMLKFLGGQNEPESAEAAENNPFAALKELFDENNNI